MKIKAKTKYGRIVTIIAFVVKYNNTYAVTIESDGTLFEHKLDALTVLDEGLEG